MIQEFREHIPNIDENECIVKIIEKHTFLIDSDKGLVSVGDKDENHLHIEKNNVDVYLVKNDGCIMIETKGGQCDLVTLSLNDVWFVEIKGTHDNKSTHRKKAYKQLANSYKFYSRHLDFDDISLNALVCFQHKRRIVQASASTKKKEFKTKYNISLKEGNYILFE